MLVRRAETTDAEAMAALINEIIAIGGTTSYRSPFDAQRLLAEFIPARRAISCVIAEDEGQLLGFQALLWSDPDWPGDAPLPEDWAYIGTYVAPGTQGRGIGRALFAQTAAAAKAAGVRYIDATIRKENTGGQAYYAGVGFEDYRSGDKTVSKRFAPT